MKSKFLQVKIIFFIISEKYNFQILLIGDKRGAGTGKIFIFMHLALIFKISRYLDDLFKKKTRSYVVCVLLTVKLTLFEVL
jgi:hypothetical protein